MKEKFVLQGSGEHMKASAKANLITKLDQEHYILCILKNRWGECFNICLLCGRTFKKFHHCPGEKRNL